MKKNISISVCMPVYNASQYICECIESILSQSFTDFELLIVDDGSTDDSVNIIRSYSDTRIRLIENKHDYIASLNLLLQEAQGKYIARMDADDIMLPNRLQMQYEFMEGHADVDVVGGEYVINDESIQIFPVNKRITIFDMLDHCCLVHPSVMMRKSSLQTHGLYYRSEYKYAEDYHLWMQMLQRGMFLCNKSGAVIKYRISQNQISNKHVKEQKFITERIRREVREWIYQQEKNVKEETVVFEPSGNKLTLVIPFMNEGEEVANTVRSARKYVGDAVDIIVVNDHSTDGYDYLSDLRGLNVRYVYNKFNIGAAASKEKGANLTTTPYFILLDAHMRFYDGKWLNRYVEELERDDRRIICCQTRWLSKENGVVDEGMDSNTWGAFLKFEDTDFPPTIHWRSYKRDKLLPHNQISAVLGATYGASKRYWTRLKGFQGLIHYGCEEAYISMKAYLEGGSCTFLEDVVIGHIYRKNAPYTVRYAESIYNNLLIIQTLYPLQMRFKALESIRLLHPDLFARVEEMLAMRVDDWRVLKSYYQENFKRPFSDILKINNMLLAEEYMRCKEAKELLPKLNIFLKERHASLCNGIVCGNMALVIYYCLYADFYKHNGYDTLASNIFHKIEINLEKNAFADFANGICGIGWGIMFLHSNSFLDDVEDLLQRIDILVMERDVRRCRDYSFYRGLGGIFAYVSQRIILYQRIGSPMFDIKYLQELWTAANDTLKQENVDPRTRFFALQLLDADGIAENETIPLNLNDVFSLPDIINNESKYWEIDMNNCVGFGIKTLLQLKKTQRILK